MKIMSVFLCLLGSTFFIYSADTELASSMRGPLPPCVVKTEFELRLKKLWDDCYKQQHYYSVYKNKMYNGERSKDEHIERVADFVADELKYYAYIQEKAEKKRVILKNAGVSLKDDDEFKLLEEEEIISRILVEEATKMFSQLVSANHDKR